MMGSRSRIQRFVADAEGVNCVRIGPCSGQVIATGGEDKNVHLWRVGKPNCLLSIKAAKTAIKCVSFDPEEKVVAAGSLSGSLHLFALNANGKTRCRLTGHRSECTSATFHPLGNVLVSGSVDTNVKIWDIRNKSCVRTFMGHTEAVNTVEYSPDGRWVASGGKDGTVKLWDLQAGKLLHDFTTHRGGITSVKFHPDEFWLATGSLDGVVKYWDLETFRLVSSTPTERGVPVRHISFLDNNSHEEGHSLVCCSDEGVRVWSWQPCRCAGFQQEDWGDVADIKISRDKSNDQQLLACSLEKKTMVSVWAINMENLNARPSPVRDNVGGGSSAGVVEGKERPISDSEEEYEEDFVQEEQEPVPVADPPEQKQNEVKPERKSMKVKTTARTVKPRNTVADECPVPKKGVVPRRDRRSKKENEGKECETPRQVVARAASRSSPLGLSISEFMPRKSSFAEIGNFKTLKSEMKMHAADDILEGHLKFQTVMQERVEELEHVFGLWTDGKTILALEYLDNLKNDSVTYDFLKRINLRNGQTATLDICAASMPCLVGLTESQFEEHIRVALTTCKFLFDSFSGIVLTTLEHERRTKHNGGRVMVDISRSERLEKCTRCRKGFTELSLALEKLVNAACIENLSRTKRDAVNLNAKLGKFMEKLAQV